MALSANINEARKAIESGNDAELAKLLTWHPKLTQLSQGSPELLMQAVDKDNLKAVQLLLDAGISVKILQSRVLSHAKNTDAAVFLIDRGAFASEVRLAQFGRQLDNPQIISLLTLILDRRGQPPDAKDAFSLLHFAIAAKKYAVAEYLLHRGVSYQSNTATTKDSVVKSILLSCYAPACAVQLKPVVLELLLQNADLNFFGPDCRTLMSLASLSEDKELVDLVVSGGANLESHDFCMSAKKRISNEVEITPFSAESRQHVSK
jgi:hypothetical protein